MERLEELKRPYTPGRLTVYGKALVITRQTSADGWDDWFDGWFGEWSGNLDGWKDKDKDKCKDWPNCSFS